MALFTSASMAPKLSTDFVDGREHLCSRRDITAHRQSVDPKRGDVTGRLVDGGLGPAEASDRAPCFGQSQRNPSTEAGPAPVITARAPSRLGPVTCPFPRGSHWVVAPQRWQ